MSTWYRKLQALNACEEAVEWAKTQPSFAVAWRTCDRGDWMLWLLRKTASTTTPDKRFVHLACDFADSVRSYTTDTRVGVCIDTVRAWLRGDATLADVNAAKSAANAAESAAWSAAKSAAWSAESTEAWSAESAANAAWSAASAAKSTAWNAASAAKSTAEIAANAAWSAKSATWSTQADIIRKVFPVGRMSARDRIIFNRTYSSVKRIASARRNAH